MPIISIASTKGGVGKSTATLNLATQFLKEGKKVAILDADSQNTISKWNKIREYMINQGENLRSIFIASANGGALLEIANDKRNQGYIVLIDCPGVDDKNMRAALLRSDFILTLCPTSSVDLWEIETLLNISKQLNNIQKRKIPVILLFNKVPTRHGLVAIREAKQFLENNNIFPDFVLETVIKERSSFKHSIKEGRGVVEYSPSDTKATTEISDAVKEIQGIISRKSVI